MSIMALNSSLYWATVGDTSVPFTLVATDTDETKWLVYNGGTTDVFATSGVTSPTAVYPSSATTPRAGKVIGPGMMATFDKDSQHQYISAIRASGSASAPVAIAVGSGE